MKKIILLVFILHLLSFNTYANYYYTIQEPTKFQSKYINFWDNQCTDYREEDIINNNLIFNKKLWRK